MSEGNTCMGNIPTAWDPLWMCCMYLHEECFPCGWHSQWAGEESRSVEITGLMMESSVKCNFPAKFNTYKEKNCSSCYLLASLHSQRWPCGISRELPRNTFFFFTRHFLCSVLPQQHAHLVFLRHPWTFSLFCWFLCLSCRSQYWNSSRPWPSSWVMASLPQALI